MDGCDGTLAALESELTDRGTIGAADVLKLRHAVYRDGRIGPAEAARLLRLNRPAPPGTRRSRSSSSRR